MASPYFRAELGTFLLSLEATFDTANTSPPIQRVLEDLSLDLWPFLCDAYVFTISATGLNKAASAKNAEMIRKTIGRVLDRLLEGGKKKEVWLSLGEQIGHLMSELECLYGDDTLSDIGVDGEDEDDGSGRKLETVSKAEIMDPDVLRDELQSWIERLDLEVTRDERDTQRLTSVIWLRRFQIALMGYQQFFRLPQLPFKKVSTPVSEVVPELHSLIQCMQESELWLDQDEWAILLELLSEAVKAIWVKLEPEWEDDQTTGSVGVATKLRSRLSDLVCKAITLLHPRMDLKLLARWYQIHHGEKLSLLIQRVPEEPLKPQLAIVSAVSETLAQSLKIDVQPNSAFDEFNPFLSFAALIAASSSLITRHPSVPIVPINLDKGVGVLGSALNGVAVDAAYVWVAESLRTLGTRILDEADAMILMELIVPNVASNSSDLERLALQDLLGSLISSVSDADGRVRLYEQLVCSVNPFTRTRISGLALLHAEIGSNLAQPPGKLEHSSNSILSSDLFYTTLAPLLFSSPPPLISMHTGGFSDEMFNFARGLGGEILPTQGEGGEEGSVKEYVDRDLQELWKDPYRPDEATFFLGWTMEGLNILYLILANENRSTSRVPVVRVQLIRSRSQNWLTALDQAVSRWENQEQAVDDIINEIDIAGLPNEELPMRPTLFIYSLREALSRVKAVSIS